MSFWSKIFTPTDYGKEQKDFPYSSVVEDILLYVSGLINRRELAQECFSFYEDYHNSNEAKKDTSSVKAYLCFEKFITENKPLIVKKETTAVSLRDEIQEKFKTENLPIRFKLIFSSEFKQILEIFKIGTSKLFEYAISNIGFEATQNIFLKSVEGNVLSKVMSFGENGIILKKEETLYKNEDINEIRYLLINLFEGVREEVDGRFGPRVSDEIITKTYLEFSPVYSFEFLQKFLNITPNSILENEKIKILAREELEVRLAASMTEEQKKRETTERLSLELKKAIEELNSSKAATLNLLEDVSREKDYVEEEVKKRTTELREETALLKSTIESLPLSFFSVDKDFNLLDYNSSLAKIISLDKINNFSEIEKKITNFFPIRENCIKVIDTNKVIITEESHFGNVSYKIYLVPVKDNENEILGVLCLLEDITEQKARERSREEFFSIASHELRTPLTAIRGNSSMILEFFLSSLPSKDVEQMIKDIHEASIRLIKIVSDFLDVSKLEQQKVVFKKEDIDMELLLKDIFREFETIAISKSLSLKMAEVEGKNLHVSGDRDRVKQVIANLLSNAVNYTRAGAVTLNLKEEGSNVSLYVTDTGVGISKENQFLLFRKFQQAQEKILTRDASRSTGLGLYISRLLAEAMMGKVELFKSEEGKGSTFRLVLPKKL